MPTKDLYLEYTMDSQNSIVRKQPNLNMGKRSEQTLHHRGYMKGKQAHEKIFDIISH